MRTTVDIDQDVLLAIKSISKEQGLTAGAVLSQLARQALMSHTAATLRNGVPLFPKSGKKRKLVTLELVNQLRDESA